MEDLNLEKTKKPKTSFLPKSLTPFRKAMTIYISLSLIILITGFVVINKYKANILESVASVARVKTIQSDTNSLLEYVALLENQSKLVESDFAKYMDLLVDKKDLPKVKQLVNSICLKYKTDPLFTFNIENPAKDAEPASYDFTLVVNGTFDNIINAFKEIETIPSLITFNNIVLEKNTPLLENLPPIEGTLNQSDPNANPSSTTTTKKKKIIKITKPSDTFKVSILGKIYLKESAPNTTNPINK